MRLIQILLTFFLIHTSNSAFAEIRCEHSKLSSTQVEWCIDKTEGSKNPDFVYAMHGGGHSAASWIRQNFFKDLKTRWQQNHVDPPTIIVFSFGPSWLLGDMATAEHPALLPITINEVMPKIEAELGGLRGRRLLLGHSMGGYNGSELVLRTDLFAKVAILCAGLVSLSPVAPPADIDAFLKRNPGARRSYVENTLAWIRSDFRTPENWNRHDPSRLILLKPRIPPFFVSCTKDDPYGFFEPSELLVEGLRGRRFPVEWYPLERGGHCASTPKVLEALARFLVLP